MAQHPELAAFDGAAADRLVEDFREADRARITLTRAEAAYAHAQRVKEVRDGAPGMAVLRGEMENDFRLDFLHRGGESFCIADVAHNLALERAGLDDRMEIGIRRRGEREAGDASAKLLEPE